MATHRREMPGGEPQPKRQKKAEVKSSATIHIPVAPEPAGFIDEDDNPFNCVICMENWSEDGEHCASSLTCGHIFGKSCILRWITTSKFCPTCKHKCTKKDVRQLYLPRFPTEKFADTATQLKNSQEEVQAIKRELARVRADQAANIAAAQPATNSLGTHSDAFNLVKSMPKASASEIELQLEGAETPAFGLVGTIPLVSSHCSAYVKAKDWLLLSCAKDSSSLYSGKSASSFALSTLGFLGSRTATKPHGVVIASHWSSLTPKLTYLPIHDRPVRCMAISPHNELLLLTSSLDGSTVLTQVDTHHEIVRIAPASNSVLTPVWACCFDAQSEHVLYLASGRSVLVYDLRYPAAPISTLHLPIQANWDASDKIFALFSTAAPVTSGSALGSSLLVGSSKGIFLFTFDKVVERHVLTDLLNPTNIVFNIPWNVLVQQGTNNLFVAGYIYKGLQYQVPFSILSHHPLDVHSYFELETDLPATLTTSTAGCIFSYGGCTILGAYNKQLASSALIAPLSDKKGASLIDSNNLSLLASTTHWRPITERKGEQIFVIACGSSGARVLSPIEPDFG